MKTIVSVSGGLSSFEALRRLIEQRGRENIVAVFADVKGRGENHYWSPVPAIEPLLQERFGGETRDTYRFLWQMSYSLDMPIERLEDGRDVFNLFMEKRAFRLFVAGRFYMPCSEALKRFVISNWIAEHFAAGEYEIALGMKWDEQHRIEAAQHWWSQRMGYEVRVFSPLAEAPYVESCDVSATVRQMGLDVPQSYGEGFEHNNCNRACANAGQGHFANLYEVAPEVYHYWAWQERWITAQWGKKVTILKDERGGETKPMTLYEFIPRIEAGDYRRLDIGGCGCFTSAFSGDLLAQAELVVNEH